MSQNLIVIPTTGTLSGLALAQALNLALDSIDSQHSGTADPGAIGAYRWWADVTSGILKQRNAANSGWINRFRLDAALPYATGTPTASVVLKGDGSWGAVSAPGLLSKADSQSVVFTKTGSGTLNLKAGTYIDMAGTLLTFAVATAVVMPAFAAGTDYAIYACADGTVRADANFTNPVGYTTGNSKMIGGFHYGLVAAGTTVAGGSFNTAGAVTTGGMVWVQSNVDDIAGINKFSLWDLKFRPLCDPRGMVLTNSSTWVDIYLCSTDPAANGTSKYNSNIASGAVLAKIPLAFGGNGTITYGAGDWWSFNEIARAYGKRFMLAGEFYDAAFGVTENQSVDATASTYPNTQRNAGYTSKYGIEQAAGVHYTWGQDSAGTASGAWVANGGRGQSANGNTVRVMLGGARASGAASGSRCSVWNYAASYSYWSIGLRAACDHLILA
jgi:hypothetical protein